MGNYLSCTLAKAGTGGRHVKVILPDGRVSRFDGPVSAAELMLEAPGHFLTEAKCMHLGHRLTALSADEELEMAGVYVILPMNRLNAIATPSDMARLLVLARKEEKRVQASARVQPDSVAHAHEKARVEEVDDAAAAAEIDEFKHRLSVGRSRRPTLETIQEENYASR
ncbi:HTH-type transcriptional regulator [Rhynchospora pubera]|uniref:HTH-type transcriptional regulator n=1 Tax=Rhynchospora pubera TaxID=906938 RepID=A0AAV8E0R4_9POAL|nr:HTH-type transcriptional regulator [Rhynchospora pubera]